MTVLAISILVLGTAGVVWAMLAWRRAVKEFNAPPRAKKDDAP